MSTADASPLEAARVPLVFGFPSLMVGGLCALESAGVYLGAFLLWQMFGWGTVAGVLGALTFGLAGTWLAKVSIRAFGAFRTRGKLTVGAGLLYVPRYDWWSPTKCLVPLSDIVALVEFGGPGQAQATIAGLENLGRPVDARERKKLEGRARPALGVVTKDRLVLVGPRERPDSATLRGAFPSSRWLSITPSVTPEGS